MRPIRWTALAVVVSIALGGSVVAAGAQSGGNEKPTASEVGITDKEIHIAVVADVDNTLQPGLFAGSVDGVKGWAKFMNKNGGLAKRKVVVDFIDSHLSNSDARNAIIQACQNDFALVGTSALFLNNVDDMKNCVDKAGAATGIPDIPVVTTEFVQQCNPTSFPINPPQLRCDTLDQHPQTYLVQAGRANYFNQKFGKGKLHGLFVQASDLASARNANKVTELGVQRLGIKPDTDTGVSALAPQSAYTPLIQEMRSKDSNYAENGSSFAGTVSLRKEAKLQGLTSPDIVWACTVQCYNRQFVEQGGADVDNQYVSLTFLPFEEASSNKMVSNFLKFTGKDKADGFGAQAWLAGILLRDAVNAVVKQSGVNGVTRKAVIDALNQIHDFTAEGMQAKTDIAARNTSQCFMLTQLKGGKFQRVFPTKAGTFDCNKKNLVTVKYDSQS